MGGWPGGWAAGWLDQHYVQDFLVFLIFLSAFLLLWRSDFSTFGNYCKIQNLTGNFTQVKPSVTEGWVQQDHNAYPPLTKICQTLFKPDLTFDVKI